MRQLTGLPLRIIALTIIVSLVGASCNRNKQDPSDPGGGDEITLTIWRVFDKPEVMQSAIDKYREKHPNIKIDVIQKNYADYELEVANGIAAHSGPDIWMIRNGWLPKHTGKLLSMPEGLLSGTQTDKKRPGDQTNLEVLKRQYPAAVAEDAVNDGKVYGVPLSIDSLALFYNKDHFREANVNPPTTWVEFIQAVDKLTQYEDAAKTKIRRAGAAIGTARNIHRGNDLLTALMLQNHVRMTDESKTSSLMNAATPKQSGGLIYPGTEALELYTGFANPNKVPYTWNNELPNSIDAFAQGKASMIFSYAYLQQTLLQKNSTLNYGVAPLPQIADTPTPVDYANYWIEVVSRDTKHAAEAWDFLRFMSQEGGDTLYQEKVGLPPAKKIETVPQSNQRILNNEKGSPWTFQATTAATWYRGKNPGKVDQIMNELIENVVTFRQPHQVAIDNAAAQITKSYREDTGD